MHVGAMPFSSFDSASRSRRWPVIHSGRLRQDCLRNLSMVPTCSSQFRPSSESFIKLGLKPFNPIRPRHLHINHLAPSIQTSYQSHHDAYYFHPSSSLPSSPITALQRPLRCPLRIPTGSSITLAHIPLHLVPPIPIPVLPIRRVQITRVLRIVHELILLVPLLFTGRRHVRIVVLFAFIVDDHGAEEEHQ